MSLHNFQTTLKKIPENPKITIVEGILEFPTTRWKFLREVYRVEEDINPPPIPNTGIKDIVRLMEIIYIDMGFPDDDKIFSKLTESSPYLILHNLVESKTEEGKFDEVKKLEDVIKHKRYPEYESWRESLHELDLIKAFSDVLAAAESNSRVSSGLDGAPEMGPSLSTFSSGSGFFSSPSQFGESSNQSDSPSATPPSESSSRSFG